MTVSFDPNIGADFEGPHALAEMCSNLAGNAWSAFHYAPLRIALTSTIGHFKKGNDLQVKKQAALSTALINSVSSDGSSSTD